MDSDIGKLVLDFESQPSVAKLDCLKKTQLLEFCKHYKIEVKTSFRKAEIRNILLEFFIDENLLSETDRDKVQTVPMDKDLEMKKLEYECQLMKLKEKEIEAQMRENELAAQLKLKTIELEAQKSQHAEHAFDISRNIKLVPPFKDTDVDKYFLHFEKVADSLHWPPAVWTLLLQSVLSGKAQEVYSSLSLDQSRNYEEVKKVILKAYELVPEAYRQKFRNSRRQESETFVEFARHKEDLFNRWCMSQQVNESHENLRQLILLEEFKRCIDPDIRSHIDEQHVKDLYKAAEMADDYSLTHKGSFLRGAGHSTSSHKKRFNQGSNASNQIGTHDDEKSDHSDTTTSTKSSENTGDQKKDSSRKKVVCSYCKKNGHHISECWFLEKKNSKTKPTALTAVLSRNNVGLSVENITDSAEFKDCTMDQYKPFISEGYISLHGENSPKHPIKILRDTGASQSLLLEGVLPLTAESSTDATVLIQGVEGGFVNAPLHHVKLDSDLVSGPVIVGTRPVLPVPGVSLLLGNDIAGGKVLPSPQMTENPETHNDTELLKENFPEIFPSCVVTRSMKNTLEKSKPIDEHELGLNDTFMYDLDNFQATSPGEEIQDKQGHYTSEDVDSPGPVPVNRKRLLEEQEKDPITSALLSRALCEDAASKVPVCYYVDKTGVLMRKWRPLSAPANKWQEIHQIVMPRIFHHEILKLSHDAPVAGHLGVRKTLDRILKHFYWPSIRKDVSSYCRTCHTCQLVGKPNQRIPPAPLKPIPAFGEPFSRVIIDCVGPLPRTKSGHEYLLTIMDAATRFPEAIPLRRITAQAVTKALVKFFTLVGLPRTVQSDQGTNFMSKIFNQVLHELGIEHKVSSPYHPESQGALERYHQTLKTMIKTYCHDHEKDWDEGVPLLLFATREVIQESLGFSPFDLVFGHSVRGPLKLLKDQWLAAETRCDLLTYVSTFRERLHSARECAKKNLIDSQEHMKSWYDRDASERNFSVGQKVLVMLPVPGSPLKARFYGPYTVSSKISDTDYEISTPGRRKQKQICHVNMIKKYHDRDECSVPVATVVVDSENGENACDQNVEDCEVGRSMKLQNSSVLNNIVDEKLSHLEPDQQNELSDLINEYSCLFPDIPSKTDMAFHDVDVGESKPIKQHPYRVHPVKREKLKAEVKYMLENEIVEGSHSEWSSPCLLVPKPDKSYRFCTDFRKVNSVTKSDSYPIPRMDDCVDKVGNANYVSKFDLLKGYWQVPLTERAKEVSAFVTPDGFYEYKVMPFGMKNSGATFQRLMNEVILELDGCDVYIDDLIIYSNTWEQHIRRIRALFDRLTKAKLTVNLVKCEFGKACVTYLGHTVGQGQVKPVQAKVEAIANFPEPQNKREVMQFIGMAGFFRKFCKNFSDVVAPMTDLLSNKVKFKWSESCRIAFENVKAILSSSPVLMSPNFEKRFKLSVDASDIAAGAVLQQEDEMGIDHPVSYFSKKFDKHQLHYSTIEKETLALMLALNHFDVYLCSTYEPILVFTDHNPLVFINKMKNKNHRILRWSLILQEFDVEICHMPGKDNIVADALSRNV